jgi:para-nitrobenzyl esterase
MFFALCTGSVAVAQPAPVVGVTGGLVQGEMVDGMAVYLGIPYAQPPVGPLRWAAPLPPVPWTGVKNATAFAPSCVQTNAAGSEDCLYVNVFVPPGLPAPAPVMVFIHGGGFVSGSAQINAISYANLSQFIIVTLQYRLNILGYMAVEGMSPALPKTPGAATFNVGLQDQQVFVCSYNPSYFD